MSYTKSKRNSEIVALMIHKNKLNVLIPNQRIPQNEFQSNSTTRRSLIFAKTSTKRITCREKSRRIRSQGFRSFWYMFRRSKFEKLQICRDQPIQFHLQKSRSLRSKSLESQSKKCRLGRSMFSGSRSRVVQLRRLYDSKCQYFSSNLTSSVRILQADQ